MTELVCWFCKKNEAQREYAITKTMYDPKSRQASIGQRARYVGVEIVIPCCEECSLKGNKVNVVAGFYLASLIIFTILSGVIGYMIETRTDIYNLSIYFGIGGFVIGLAMAFPVMKIFGSKIGGGTQNWSAHPEVQKRIKNGWTVGTPPV